MQMDKVFIKEEIARMYDQAQAMMLRLNRLQGFIDELTPNGVEQVNEVELDIPEACRQGIHYENEDGRLFDFCPDCGEQLNLIGKKVANGRTY